MSSPKNPHRIIIILGPTASGKSGLAVKIAKKFNGEIISADSRQIYKGLDIGSGKITKKEMRGIHHYLLDVASPKRTFTVAQYQKLARDAIQKIWARGKLPILCGGTGFYIDALLNNYDLPAVKPDQKLRRELEKKTAASLFKELKKLDPRRAKNIDRHNKCRLVRALEITLKTGKPIPLIIRANKGYSKILKIGLLPPANDLKSRIKKRLLKRLRQGMIEEVEKLRASGLSWKRLENFGLEYRYVTRYLQDKISHKEMIKILEKEIWHYAKRQMTWFRRDKRTLWIHTESEAQKLVRDFLKS